MINITTI